MLIVQLHPFEKANRSFALIIFKSNIKVKINIIIILNSLKGDKKNNTFENIFIVRLRESFLNMYKTFLS